MTKKISLKAILLIQLIFLVIASTFFVIHRLQLPRVMIVHSYDTNYNWVQEINKGLTKVFEKQPNIILNWQYLNVSNNPSASYKQRAGLLVRRMINNLQPTIIIAVDDDAQDYVGKFYIDDPDITVIYCAINGNPETYEYDTAKNVTGVMERTPIEAIKDIIPYIVAQNSQADLIKIIALGDLSKTVKFNDKYYQNYGWAPLNLIDTVSVSNFDDWKNIISDASKRADCILLMDCSEIEEHAGSKKLISAAQVIKWTEQNCEIPVIGCNDEHVSDGGSLAVVPSGYEQGEIAAQYALRILNGEDASVLPVVSTTQFLIHMRANVVQKFPRLPAIYAAFARGIDKFYIE